MLCIIVQHATGIPWLIYHYNRYLVVKSRTHNPLVPGSSPGGPIRKSIGDFDVFTIDTKRHSALDVALKHKRQAPVQSPEGQFEDQRSALPNICIQWGTACGASAVMTG